MHLMRLPVQFLVMLALALIASVLLASCADSAKPEDAVIPYLEALLDNDSARVLQSVCPEWEANAQRDADAFSGITGVLRDAECKTAGNDGDYTLVTCTGTMVLDYNGELRDRSLAGQTYRVKQVNGDWKMCGYE